MAMGPTYVDGATGNILKADVVAILDGAANVPQTSPTVQDVIDALIVLGLVEQSDA